MPRCTDRVESHSNYIRIDRFTITITRILMPELFRRRKGMDPSVVPSRWTLNVPHRGFSVEWWRVESGAWFVCVWYVRGWMEREATT